MSHLRQKHKREVVRLNAYIADRDSEIKKQVIEYKSVLDYLEKSTNQCHEEKQCRRQLVQNESDEKKKLKNDNQYMHDWLMEMSDEVKDAKEDAKEAMRKASTSNTLASNRQYD
mgnify:CR=1 FL=1